MVMSRCDLATLLALYDEPFWHACVLETLRKWETPISEKTAANLEPFEDVVEKIKKVPYEDRYVTSVGVIAKIIDVCQI